jgi:hypothetical protein
VRYSRFAYGLYRYGSDTYAPLAGVTHDVTFDDLGLMLRGGYTRSDITSAVPRVSIGTDQKKHTDFSERDTWGQESWHHGRGELEIKDPVAFLDSVNLVTWIPNQLTLLPDYTAVPLSGGGTDLAGYPTDSITFQGNLYFLIYGNLPTNNKLVLYNNTNSNWDTVSAGLDTTSGEPWDLHVFDANMYITQGETVNMRRFNGTTFTNHGYPARYLATYDSKLWRADNINELWYSTNPELDASATWTGPLEVGDAAYPINGMIAGYDGALWVGKDDGIYSVRLNNAGTGYTVTVAIDLSQQRSTRNGKAMDTFGGNLYFSVGTSIVRFDGNTIQFMGPDRGAHETELFYQTQTRFGGTPLEPIEQLPATYQAGVTGGISKLAHDNNFLYAAVDNEGLSSSYVMIWGGTGWHKIRETPEGAQIRSVFFTGALATSGELEYPILWWSESTGNVMYHQKWPRFSQNPLDDEGLHYTSTGNVETGWFDAGLRDVDKSVFDFVLRARNLLPGGNEVLIEFQVDDFPIWYTLGTASVSPESVLHFPDDSLLGEPAITTRRIRFRLTLNRGSTVTTTPIVQSWGHRFVVRPDARYGWQMTVNCSNNFTNYFNEDETGKAQQIRHYLYSKRDKKLPLSFKDGTELPGYTNLLTNPSFEIDSNADGLADGLTVVGSGITTDLNAQYKAFGVLSQRVTFGSGSGDKGLRLATITGVPAGDVLFASAYVYIISGDNVTLEITYLVGGVEVRLDVSIDDIMLNYWEFRESSFSEDNAARFKRGYVYATTPTDGTADEFTTYSLYLRRKSSFGSNATMFCVDACELIHTTYLEMQQPNYDYIDGDQLRCRWEGTPHQSASTRQKSYFVYITGLSESFRYDENKVNFVERSSDITLSIREME